MAQFCTFIRELCRSLTSAGLHPECSDYTTNRKRKKNEFFNQSKIITTLVCRCVNYRNVHFFLVLNNHYSSGLMTINQQADGPFSLKHFNTDCILNAYIGRKIQTYKFHLFVYSYVQNFDRFIRRNRMFC